MLTASAILGQMKADQAALQESVFSSPPSSWDEFNKRLGRWCALEDQIRDITQALRRNEETDK